MKPYSLYHGRRRIHLGHMIGQGGEGAIYTIPNQSECVAKIYAKQPDARKAQKLLAMPGLVTDQLRKIAAWPLDVVVDARNSVCGFVMPKVAARKDIHELYSPKSRAQSFPEADFRFLVHVCGNIARAFSVIHSHGHVIGDINHGSVLVGPDGLVVLIDCDSFQIRTANGEYTCDVGVPLFTAPELQGRSLRGTRRTPNHDRFGMAVLIFHLLCLGRHPFAGRYSGAGEMPIEKAITEFRFAYGRNRTARGMDQPPSTPPLEALGAAVSSLFEQAFAPLAVTSGRPEEKAWVAELDELKSKLRVCASAAWHHYSSELKTCPWCVVESKTPIRLFGQRVTSTVPTGVVDVGTLWRAIVAVESPGPDPPLPSEQPWALPMDADIPDRSLRLMRRLLCCLAICLGIGGCMAAKAGGGALIGFVLCGIGLAIWPWVSQERRAEVQREVATSAAEYSGLRARWTREATIGAFNDKRRALDAARAELEDLPNERRRALAKLDAEREAQQLYRHLDSLQISHAKIRHIGPGRTAMLASYGIETAADIEARAIRQIPGFGKSTTGALVAWREMHKRNFRFNPNEPVDPQELAKLDQRVEARRQELVATLRQGPAALRIAGQEITSARNRIMPVLNRTWIALKVAEARQAAL